MNITTDLKIIKKISWDDVFEVWRKNEDYPGSHWIPLWQERGYESWDEWRRYYADRFQLQGLDWTMYEIINPMEFIPQIAGGSFSSWVKKFYQGEDNPMFTKIVQHPDIQNHQGVLEFMDNFPAETIISGVVLKDKIVVVEGMHRCAAIALAAKRGKSIKTKMQICLAEHFLEKLPVSGQS